MAAAQIVVKRRLGKLVVPVPAGDGGVDLPRCDGRRTEVQQLQVGGAGFLNIRPEPPQVVKLVAAAGIGEGQCVKIVARKNALSAAASTVPFSL